MRFPILAATVLILSACATTAPAPTSTSPDQVPTASAGQGKKAVKSVDGTFTGEIIGDILPDSKFSKLKIGMMMSEVHSLIKAPDDLSRHETGKRWIPFYFGGDAQRLEAYYAGEGCLTYTGGNVFGGSGGKLIRITVDKTISCFQ